MKQPMSRSSVTFALGVVSSSCLLAGLEGSAAADSWSAHILANARTGWSDNIFSAPSDAESGAGREADIYTQLMPGGLFTWESPRMVHELSYELDANLYARHDEAWSLSHRASWRSFWLTSPLSEMSTSLSASAGTLNTFTTATTAANGQVTLLPSGSSDFAALEAREHFSLQLSRPYRMTQGAVGRVFSTETPDSTDPDEEPDAGTTGIEVGGSLGLDRSWHYNALGVLGSASLVSLDSKAGGMTVDTVNQVNTQLGLSWRRDLTVQWNMMVDGGVTALVPLDEGDELVVQPTIGAQIGYFPDWGSAGLGVRRTVAPNLYIARNTISDSAVVNAWLPLPWLADDPHLPKLSVQGTLGYSKTSVLASDTGQVVSGFNVASADAAVNYAIKPQMHVSLRYQFLIQQADAAALDQIPSYYRNTVLLTFYGRFPERVAAEVPLRASLRVDRSDTTPVGDEVGAPAPR